MDVHSNPIPVPEVKFRDRTHPGYKALIDDIPRPRSNPYYLLWRRSPIWTKTPQKTYNAPGYAQQMGVTRFYGQSQPHVNARRSYMTPRSGNMPRVQGVQGDDVPLAGGNTEDSKYYYPTVGFSTVERDQPATGGHLTQIARNPWNFSSGFGGPSNRVVQR